MPTTYTPSSSNEPTPRVGSGRQIIERFPLRKLEWPVPTIAAQPYGPANL